MPPYFSVRADLNVGVDVFPICIHNVDYNICTRTRNNLPSDLHAYMDLPTYLAACLPACLPAYLPTSLPACLPACLPPYLRSQTDGRTDRRTDKRTDRQTEAKVRDRDGRHRHEARERTERAARAEARSPSKLTPTSRPERLALGPRSPPAATPGKQGSEAFLHGMGPTARLACKA